MKLNWKIILLIAIPIVGALVYWGINRHSTLLTLVHANKLTVEILDQSLLLGQKFLIANQKPEGNFNYEYDFVNDEFTPGDSQVRQAGALWGVALTHLELPGDASRMAAEKGIAFFEKHSRQVDNGQLIAYPGERIGRTGTMSLATLSLIDFLRAEPNHPNRSHYDSLLQDYVQQLLALRMENGQFHSAYNLRNGKGLRDPSPYFDGETLLALSRAARYLGYDSLKNTILESAESMYQNNVVEARKIDADSDVTKGFYQWGSMSFYEIYAAGWDDKWAARTIEMADWMIDTHRTLLRTKNTAYAYEGLASAWKLAQLSGDDWAVKKIGTVIDIGLYKLISWQVGGPLEDSYLKDNPPAADIAIGGVINRGMLIRPNEPLLRIDVTQHQCHAMILAKKYIYDPK